MQAKGLLQWSQTAEYTSVYNSAGGILIQKKVSVKYEKRLNLRNLAITTQHHNTERERVGRKDKL